MIKRFYRSAGIAEAGDGFAVTLDGKPMRTPAKAGLAVPRHALAAAIAEEWLAQGESVDPITMPLTRIATIAIDLVAPRRQEVVKNIVKYAETDLVCYRAGHPPALVKRQQAAWQPLVDWVEGRYGARLEVTEGVVPRRQPDAALTALAAAVEIYDPWTLAPLNLAAAACGSVVVALALAEGRLDADAAFAASELDESYEIEQWGEDAEQMRRRAALGGDIAASARFLALLRA